MCVICTLLSSRRANTWLENILLCTTQSRTCLSWRENCLKLNSWIFLLHLAYMATALCTEDGRPLTVHLSQ